MSEEELNDNDNKLLAYCHNRRRFISDIARNIGIDVKNVSVRVEKLEKMKLIKVSYVGNKKFIQTISDDNTNKYFSELLKELEVNKGEMKKEEFLSLLPFNFGKEFDSGRFNAPLKIMWVQPRLVEEYVKITKEGKKFLEENK